MSYTELQCKVIKKARKPYRCEWCDTLIETTEPHRYRTYIWEGDFSTGRMHLDCWDAMDKVPSDELEEGWSPGDYKRGKSEVEYA